MRLALPPPPPGPALAGNVRMSLQCGYGAPSSEHNNQGVPHSFFIEISQDKLVVADFKKDFHISS